ncbi:MAG: c-type cytochrome [Gemmatimonadota bacterium]
MAQQRTVCIGSLLAVLFIGAGTSRAEAQGFRWPEEPENIKVLPDSVTGARLGRVMRGFALGLGVRCTHCHVGEEGADLSTFDFAADDKEEKRIARVMLEMVQAINGSHLARLEELGRPAEGRVRVTCVTCHHGRPTPRLIEDVIGETLATDGIEAAVAQYRELRESFFGGFAYDFSPGPLATLGQRLALQGKLDEAETILQLEAELHPESYSTYFALGGIQARAGRTEEAVKSLEKALEYAPEQAKGFIQRQLSRIQAP